MAAGAQQLAADFEQVQNQLLLYPAINILETEGDPRERTPLSRSPFGAWHRFDGCGRGREYKHGHGDGQTTPDETRANATHLHEFSSCTRCWLGGLSGIGPRQQRGCGPCSGP